MLSRIITLISAAKLFAYRQAHNFHNNLECQGQFFADLKVEGVLPYQIRNAIFRLLCWESVLQSVLFSTLTMDASWIQTWSNLVTLTALNPKTILGTLIFFIPPHLSLAIWDSILKIKSHGVNNSPMLLLLGHSYLYPGHMDTGFLSRTNAPQLLLQHVLKNGELIPLQ